MKNFLPYSIIHIDLSKTNFFNLPEPANRGRYIVIWWKEIALGDFYVKPNEQLSEEEYHYQIANSIFPTLRSFASETNLNFEWREFLLTNKIHDWAREMERIFSFDNVKEKPERVPISVIICTRNRPQHIYNCLDELRKSTCQPQEIIVVDNAPNDDKTQEIVRQFSDVIYVKEPRKGLDIARNTGILTAGCSIIAFTDDDVQVHPLWVYRVWETFQTASVAAMTGLVIAMSLETEAQFIFEKYWSFNRGYLDKTYDKAYFSALLSKGPPTWEIGAGANMAFRKSIFEEVGYFHELLDVGAAGCNGDSEMWYRILAKGYTIQYNPKTIAFHIHRQEIQSLKKQLFNYMRGFTTSLLWQHKQQPDSGYRVLVFWDLSLHYAYLLLKGFPRYRHRYQTLWAEIKGVFSGLAYFYSKENRPSFSVRK